MKTLLSEYKKSKKSGWKYQPKMKAVNGADLKVGDLVIDTLCLNRWTAVLKYDKARAETMGQLFSGLAGNARRYIQRDGLIPFNDDLVWFTLDLEDE